MARIDTARLKMLAGACWTGGAIVLGVMCIGLHLDSGMFLRAWLFGWYFWMTLTMGCFAILMLQYLIHAEWGFVIRRQLEAGAFTLPFMAILFLPVLFGMKQIYEWSVDGVPAPVVESIYYFKNAWLQPAFFVVRAIIYYAVWLVILRALLWLSRDETRESPRRRDAALNGLAAGGLIAYFLVFTLAATDWIMSLEPEWHSTVFAAQLMMGHAIMGISLAVLATVWLRGSEPLSRIARTQHINDLGNMLLAFVMLWTYMAFVQYLIIWNGNLREDNVWFIHRSRGWWPVLAAALAIVHFAIPFAILLSRTAKRNAAIMAGVAGLLVVSHMADCFWLIAPNFTDGRERVSWMDFVALIGIGGVWLGFFLYRLASVPLIPAHDFFYEDTSRRALEGEAHG